MGDDRERERERIEEAWCCSEEKRVEPGEGESACV